MSFDGIYTNFLVNYQSLIILERLVAFMLNKLIKRVFGSRNDRIIHQMQEKVHAINAFEPQMKVLSDQALAAKSNEFKERLQLGQSLDALLVETFAVVREASIRTLGLRHFDVQLIGGMVLHYGNIAEMRTGEGKTLVATLPAYLNALTGHSVHIVTVNDYLAKRDSDWMRPIYEFLGLRVGVIYPDMSQEHKKATYQTDIIFGTNNEFGFDYLRDNMAFSLEDKVQGRLNFAIIDEVDSVLIDEARTPLIISGAAEDSSELYIKINQIIPQLTAQKEADGPGDYLIDEKQKQVHLTEDGHQHIEELLIQENLIAAEESLYHASNIILMHHVSAALKAHAIFQRDVDYIVKNNQVVIVDEHTGRTMPGRRWSDGLHQAVEAKEHVAVQPENQTLASITFQNFFKLYQKLAGMTGTADTEAFEFLQIYNLEVVVIPTSKPMSRVDEPDLVYLTQDDKYQAIIEDIKNTVARNQPVLVGTVSIEASELLSSKLKKLGIQHQVLNAKFHEKEAQIIAEAGRPGVITIATNMAGRGTDIVLGGSLSLQLQTLTDDVSDEKLRSLKAEWHLRHEQVLQAGGLRIIGSERHESRRIDNQLRGRAGRQGDPGSSRFYLSLEDNLMRIFASERVSALMRRLGMNSGEPIEHRMVTKAIENAQRKLEGHHFDMRKQLLSYDNVANDQRKVIYKQRAEIMALNDPLPSIDELRADVISALVDRFIPPQSFEDQWDLATLTQVLVDEFSIEASIQDWIDQDSTIQAEGIKEKLAEIFQIKYQMKIQNLDHDALVGFEKSIILQAIDAHWREHLAAMDCLRQGIHLRGYAQKDPKQEYKREAFNLFSLMLDRLKYEITRMLLTDDFRLDQQKSAPSPHQSFANINLVHQEEKEDLDRDSNVISFDLYAKKTGRNDICPCGSGKKYKNCHGSLT